MSTEFCCPKGHRWEFDAEDEIDPSTGTVACPVCGILWSPTLTIAQNPVEAVQASDELTKLMANFHPPGPETIPGFEIQEVLGAGGMGTVYKARQITMDRIVALKVPKADRMDLPNRLRIQSEARAAARLQHPNIAQVFEVGDTSALTYLVLEYCSGGSLARRLDGTPLNPRFAAEIVRTVARAVGYAHHLGVIHRDLKPDNILLNVGPLSESPGWKRMEWRDAAGAILTSVKVSDFGLARRMDSDLDQTQTGTVLGTPSYMAPEQARGEIRNIGTQADVYSLGAMLYELLTGRTPFRGTTPLETLEQVCTRQPVPPARLQPAIPKDLETVTLACLRKESSKRYPTAVELADDLDRFLSGRPVLARPVGMPERFIKLAKRNPLLTITLLLLILSIALGLGFGVWKQFRLVEQRDRAIANVKLAMQAVDGLLTEVAEKDLAAMPHAEPTRMAILEKALGIYQGLLSVEVGDPSIAWEVARATRRKADIYRLLGRYHQALQTYQESLLRLYQLQAAGRKDVDLRFEESLNLNWQGETYRLLEKLDDADQSYQKAAVIQSDLLSLHPDTIEYAKELAQSLNNRGIIAGALGRFADAELHFQEAARFLGNPPEPTLEQLQLRATIAINLSEVYRKQRRSADAVRSLTIVQGPLDALIKISPDRPDFRHMRAVAGMNLAIAHLETRDNARALTAANDARSRLEELTRDYPSTAIYRAELARSCTVMAASAPGRKVAEECTQAAVGHWQSLITRWPNVPTYRGEHGLALGNLGRLTRDRPQESREYLTQGIQEVLSILQTNPDDLDFRHSLVQQSGDLADNLVLAGDDAAIMRLADKIRDGLSNHTYGTRRAVCFLAHAARAASKPGAAQKGGTQRIDRFLQHAIHLLKSSDAVELQGLLDDPDCEPFRTNPSFREAILSHNK